MNDDNKLTAQRKEWANRLSLGLQDSGYKVKVQKDSASYIILYVSATKAAVAKADPWSDMVEVKEDRGFPAKNYVSVGSYGNRKVFKAVDAAKAQEIVEYVKTREAAYEQRLRAQANKLHGEMGQAISYEHALAQMGVQRSDVASPIYGAQVSATDNYKRETPVKMCKNTHCSLAHRPQPDSVDECPDCQEPLQTVMKRTPPMDLRNKLAQHIVGVETKDGRRVWFQEPVPPRHHNWGGSDEEKKPVRPPNDAEKRLGKWW